MLASEVDPISQSLKERIEEHVVKSVREQTVIYCGESAASGLWNTEPPQLEKPEPSNEQKLTSSKEEDCSGDSFSYKPTPNQLTMATMIVKFAQTHDYKAEKVPGMPLLIVRRMGYSKDNPMQMVGLMNHKNNIPGGMDVFHFKTWPTYTLEELLPEILKKLKKINGMPGLIWVDEKSLVKPLRQVLQAASEAIGFHEKVEVEWYPPPSEEEEAYHGQYPGF